MGIFKFIAVMVVSAILTVCAATIRECAIENKDATEQTVVVNITSDETFEITQGDQELTNTQTIVVENADREDIVIEIKIVSQ